MRSKARLWLSAAAAVAVIATSVSTTVATASSDPAWYGNGHRVDGAGDLVVKVLNGSLSNTASPGSQGSACSAEVSATGNVQVNCLAEDGSSRQNTQSETSVAVSGTKVVVGFNDSLVCCFPSLNFTGYSVSNNGGGTFTDMGDLPFQPNVQPIGDPAVAADDAGNFYFASLALSSAGFGAHSLISFYEMKAGSSTFQLVSVPVDVGSAELAFADKEYLAVARDGNGRTHFYITWTSFTRNPQSPIMLTDSTDGVNWRTTMVSASDACAQGSNPVPAGGRLYVSWEQSVPAGCTDFTITAANEMMATIDVATAGVLGRTAIAPINGSGDRIVACNNSSDLREVIETQPGHDARLFEMPTTTIDSNGVLYAAWNDRPQGVGGDTGNATRVFFSFSRDGNVSWSSPVVISGKLSRTTMSDRFQPWITADSGGVHAMWYERTAGSPADLIVSAKADLSLATSTAAPKLTATESQLSSVSFPIIQTNPQQDPVISFCYMGDYNNIASDGTHRYVTWGDNRNVVTTSAGSENQPDVFFQKY